jgi:hypothetical protein
MLKIFWYENQIIKKNVSPVMVVHACNPSTWEVEAGGLQGCVVRLASAT